MRESDQSGNNQSGGSTSNQSSTEGRSARSGSSRSRRSGGRTPCAFFLRTGTCAYGDQCRFHHPQGTVPPSLNSRGFPLRDDQSDCAFYLRRGWCAFGSSCKFNHPELYTGYQGLDPPEPPAGAGTSAAPAPDPRHSHGVHQQHLVRQQEQPVQALTGQPTRPPPPHLPAQRSHPPTPPAAPYALVPHQLVVQPRLVPVQAWASPQAMSPLAAQFSGLSLGTAASFVAVPRWDPSSQHLGLAHPQALTVYAPQTPGMAVAAAVAQLQGAGTGLEVPHSTAPSHHAGLPGYLPGSMARRGHPAATRHPRHPVPPEQWHGQQALPPQWQQQGPEAWHPPPGQTVYRALVPEGGPHGPGRQPGGPRGQAGGQGGGQYPQQPRPAHAQGRGRGRSEQ